MKTKNKTFSGACFKYEPYIFEFININFMNYFVLKTIRSVSKPKNFNIFINNHKYAYKLYEVKKI